MRNSAGGDRVANVGTVSNETVSQIPLVNYLQLTPTPHLVANECVACGARFFDRRNACAGCFATEFRVVEIATTGILTSFTIVTFAAPGVPVPFVAGIVDCNGTSVRANIVNVAADPEHVKLGMALRLTTNSIGTDDNGVEGVGFGFEPAA